MQGTHTGSNTYKLIAKTDYEYLTIPKGTIRVAKAFQEYVFNSLNGQQPNFLNSSTAPLSYLGIGKEQVYRYISYEINTGINKISTETDSAFTDNGVIVSKQEYVYGNPNHVYPTKIKVRNSDNKEHLQDLRYPLDSPSDYLSQNSEHIQAKTQLVNDWNISPILETTSIVGSSIENTYNVYKKFPDCQAPLISKIITDRNGTDKEEQVVCDKYDSYGNPISILRKGANRTVYLWSYFGRYPIARIENATYDQVSTTLNSSFLSFLCGATNPSNEMITSMSSSLRTSLPDAQITTYTYKPLVGLTSVTDPRGVTTYYNYDNSGRLLSIKDTNDNLIKSYDYNYKH